MELVLHQLLELCPLSFVNQPDPHGWTPLHILAGGRGDARAAMTQQLCDARADLQAVKKRNMTPFLVACSVGDKDVAGVLLANGCDPYARTTEGATALDLAWANTPMQDMLRLIGVEWGAGPSGTGRLGGGSGSSSRRSARRNSSSSNISTSSSK